MKDAIVIVGALRCPDENCNKNTEAPLYTLNCMKCFSDALQVMSGRNANPETDEELNKYWDGAWKYIVKLGHRVWLGKSPIAMVSQKVDAATYNIPLEKGECSAEEWEPGLKVMKPTPSCAPIVALPVGHHPEKSGAREVWDEIDQEDEDM